MNRLLAPALAWSLIALSSPVLSQVEETPDSVSVSALRGPLHLIQGRGGNVVASVGVDGILLVDDDYAGYGPVYQKAITELAGSDLAPSFILNTHWHSDHTGSNEYWALQGAVIFAHDNVRLRMSSQQNIEALDMIVEASPELALPVVTFADSLALHFNGSDIEVQYYPGGHTDGDSVIFYSQDNVLHTGDLFFKDRFPYVDLSTGGNVQTYTENVAALLERIDDETIVIPGHGAVANKADLQRFHQMLVSTSATVRSALAQGESLDAVIARGLGDEWVSWGKDFVDEASWITAIADSR